MSSRLGILFDLEYVTDIDLDAKPSMPQALWYDVIINSMVLWGGGGGNGILVVYSYSPPSVKNNNRKTWILGL